MDWRREDSGYAAATLVAAALVGYLLAGNFGLVRSPFGPSGVEAAPPQVAVFAGARRSPQATTSAAVGPPASASPRSTPSGTTTSADESAPTATIDPPSTAEVTVLEGAEVTGSAGDSGSGVDRVILVFRPEAGDPISVPAEVTCPDDARSNCTWVADVPDYAGSYTLTAHATDREGNVGRSAAVQLTVLNVGKLVEDLTTEGVGTVTELLGALL